MPQYLYACSNDDNTEPVFHRMDARIVVVCGYCGEFMHRRPQPFRVNVDPFTILADWSEENWIRHKKRRQGIMVPRYSPDRVNRPEGIPGKDADYRRRN